ncbi:MAG: hypothetical protein IPJ88_08545 [Myxococcales bacterium]|nr:MAG: hypothetical protein IPJ88_08545 [Myxococcales bacterium]
MVGRILAKPGDTISYDREQIRVNTSRPELDFREKFKFVDYVRNRTYEVLQATEQLNQAKYEIFDPPDRNIRLRGKQIRTGFFLLGDNRTRTHGDDSRAFGEVDPLGCKGRVFMRLQASKQTPPELKNSWLDFISGG